MKKTRGSDTLRDTLSLGSSVLLVALLLAGFVDESNASGLPITSILMSKRAPLPQANDELLADGTSDDVRYDEYPVVVPKRAAVIIDRILKEIEASRDNHRLENDWGSQKKKKGNGGIYFRCYFNAVSCYRRKK